MAKIAIDILEKQPKGGEKRVIRHVFFGKSEAEAKHYIRSHRKSDKFFDAAMAGRPYKGIELETRKPQTLVDELIAKRDRGRGKRG